MFADVCVGARSLGERAHAVASAEARFDQRDTAPVGGEGDRGPFGEHRSETILGQGEGFFVVGTHGHVKESAVTQAHLGRDVAEHRHERLQ